MRYFLFLGFLVFAQYINAQTDTIIDFFQSNGATLIESPNGGYVSGTNGYGDSEKLQAFYPFQSESVLGAFIWFGSKTYNSLDVQSRLCLKVKTVDTSETNTAPFFRGITNTIDSTWISMADVDTGLTFPNDLQYFSFDSPVLVKSFYAIGLNFDSLARDTSGNLLDSVALFNSAKDSVSAVGMSWEKWNGNYKRIIDTWGFDLDFAIFPVIDTTLNLVHNVNNLDFDIFPNPTSNYFQIQAKLAVNSSVELIDFYGKVILKQYVEAACDKLTIDLNSIRSGYYLVKITNPKQIGIRPLFVN
jgi:hypothetical protein